MSQVARRSIGEAAVTTDPAGLCYVKDDSPGISRKRRGNGFVYLDAKGRVIRDSATLSRIRSLVIPPAWRDVWICPKSSGHIQAVGRDARGRKQYRYHPRWQQTQQETKFHRMLAFGRVLSAIRRRLRADLRKKGLVREKVLAAIVTLLESTHIRVGNEEYASQNGSYGLVTLQNRHVRVWGGRVRFRFRGKSGKEHEVELHDPRLARIIKACQEIPGQELFQYTDDDDVPHDVNSTDVNDYIRAISGGDFTTKDFRTWAGTVLFINALRSLKPCTSHEAKRKLIQLVAQVAAELGNTPAVCRKYYIHPRAVETFLNNSIHEVIQRVCRSGDAAQHLSTERLVMRLLKAFSNQEEHASTRPG